MALTNGDPPGILIVEFFGDSTLASVCYTVIHMVRVGLGLG